MLRRSLLPTLYPRLRTDGVEVTFYLPTGTVMGNLEPCRYFDQKLLHYLQTAGVDHNHPTPTGGNCGKSKVTYQRSSGDVNQHDQIPSVVAS